MTFKSIIHSIPGWLNTEESEPGIVISSRVRLARNVAGFIYAHCADDNKLAEIVSEVMDAVDSAGYNTDNFFRNDDLNDLQKNIFIERNLISPSLASQKGNRGVLVMDTEYCSIMINEEDHLRIQCILAGFNPINALEKVMDIETNLSRNISFSFSQKYGYLTVCPTNMGTGLRVSVLIHLPALMLTKEIQKVVRSAAQLNMAVRGYRGEGSDFVGNLFQISNQRSLGLTEHEIVLGQIDVVNNIIDYEKNAADMLMKEAKNQIEDKIWRSVGILKTARVISSHEFMNLSSAVRLGMYLGLVDKSHILPLNELMIVTQPGHLQERIGKQVGPLERDAIRANLIRERFVDVGV